MAPACGRTSVLWQGGSRQPVSGQDRPAWRRVRRGFSSSCWSRVRSVNRSTPGPLHCLRRRQGGCLAASIGLNASRQGIPCCIRAHPAVTARQSLPAYIVAPPLWHRSGGGFLSPRPPNAECRPGPTARCVQHVRRQRVQGLLRGPPDRRGRDAKAPLVGAERRQSLLGNLVDPGFGCPRKRAAPFFLARRFPLAWVLRFSFSSGKPMQQNTVCLNCNKLILY